MTETPDSPSPDAPPVAPAGSPEGEKGFPEGTPLAEMTDAQKAAYWQHYARKHEDTVKGFKGLTPQQVAELQTKVEELESQNATAEEKAIKEAVRQAQEEARSQAEAMYLPQIQRSDVQGMASTVVSGDKLKAFMDLVSPAKQDGGFHPPTALLGDDGKVSEEKVMGYLTAMYGGEPPNAGPRWQNFGQYSPPPPGPKPGSGGLAEAQRRQGIKPNS